MGAVASLSVRGYPTVAVMAVLGVYLPPFAYVAAVPGGPYTDRYVYLVLPAVYVAWSWGTCQLGILAFSLVRRPAPLA